VLLTLKLLFCNHLHDAIPLFIYHFHCHHLGPLLPNHTPMALSIHVVVAQDMVLFDNQAMSKGNPTIRVCVASNQCNQVGNKA
jgi:hypothetical protein